MKSRFAQRRQGILTFAAAMLVSLTGATTSVAFASDLEPAGPAEIAPAGAETIQAPATFFTINAVLAKLDRERGRGPNAVRLAALTPPSSTATDAAPEPVPPAAAPPLGITARIALILAGGAGVTAIGWAALYLAFGTRALALTFGNGAEEA